MRGSTALLWLVCSVWPGVSVALEATPRMDVQRLSWLEGTWTGTTNGVQMTEHWGSPLGGCLLGTHKDTKNGRMIAFEFARIVASAPDTVCFMASPNGAPPTPFCAIEMSDRRVVFENRAHDFPQRILYWLDEKKLLHARIEGTIGGATRFEAWIWSKTGIE